MAIVIRFNAPPEADINRIRVYESTTPDGVFLAIQTTVITWTTTQVSVPTGTLVNYYRLSFIDTADQESPLSPVVRGADLKEPPEPEKKDFSVFIYKLGLVYFNDDQTTTANSKFAAPGKRTLQQGYTRERIQSLLIHSEHAYDEAWIGGGVRARAWFPLILNKPVLVDCVTDPACPDCEFGTREEVIDPYLLTTEMAIPDALILDQACLVSTRDMLPVGAVTPVFELADGETLIVRT